MKVYGFSGLGADERVYYLLNEKLITEIIPVAWIPPFEKESIEEYAFRLSKKIEKSEEVILVGVSFGGIIAIEIAKLITPHKIILISSAVTLQEIPWYFRMMGLSKINKIIPPKFILPPAFINNWVFSIKKNEYKAMLKDILESTDKAFAKWAINQITNWKNLEEPRNVIRIHGTRDRLLPATNKTNIKINDAGHFMVIENAEEIAAIINRELKD